MVTGLSAVIKWLVVIVSGQSDPARLCLQQMQTAVSNKCKLPFHANLVESKWTSHQCNTKASVTLMGLKVASLLLLKT